MISRKLYAPAVILALVAAMVAFTRIVVLGRPVVTYSDGLVSAGNITRPWDGFFVHVGREHFIRVGGNTYRRVRGLPPFYLTLSNLHAILFVTDAPSDEVRFHIVETNSNREIVVTGQKLSFGINIGGPDPPGAPYTDFVEAEAAREVVLATRYPHAKTRVFLDLPSRRVVKVEYDEYQTDGSLKTAHVYIDGVEVHGTSNTLTVNPGSRSPAERK